MASEKKDNKTASHSSTGQQNKTALVICAVLICAAMLSNGCNSFPLNKFKLGKSSQVDAIKNTPAEEKKAKLLKKLDKKFENPQTHYELGKLYQEDGLWAQAEYRYNCTLSFDPAHRGAQAAMVKVLQASGDQAKSELSAEIYISQVNASAAESLKLALAFQKQQLDDYALQCYQQSLRLAPNSPKINRQIGYYYLSRGDREQAKSYLTRSFNLDSNQPDVAGELGRLGVGVRVPRKAKKNTKKLDKIVDKSINE